jgi:hypothetical protein
MLIFNAVQSGKYHSDAECLSLKVRKLSANIHFSYSLVRAKQEQHASMVSWCSWLSHQSNTLKVPRSSLGEIIFFRERCEHPRFFAHLFSTPFSAASLSSFLWSHSLIR